MQPNILLIISTILLANQSSSLCKNEPMKLLQYWHAWLYLLLKIVVTSKNDRSSMLGLVEKSNWLLFSNLKHQRRIYMTPLSSFSIEAQMRYLIGSLLVDRLGCIISTPKLILGRSAKIDLAPAKLSSSHGFAPFLQAPRVSPNLPFILMAIWISCVVFCPYQ